MLNRIYCSKRGEGPLDMETIGRLLITIALVGVLFAVGRVVVKAFDNSEEKYERSFTEFVDGINKMPSGSKDFALQLNENSAVIGFSKNTNAFNCYCGSKTSGVSVSERLNIIIDKPNSPECANNACVCLCNLKTESQTIDGADGLRGECIGKPLCKKLNDEIGITDKTKIRKFTRLLGGNWYQYWDKSFLFYRGGASLNGLTWTNANQNEGITLYVQKIHFYGPLQQGQPPYSIGVCNSDMLKYNQQTLNLPENTCINS